jgi:hypothetical protein
LPGIVQSIHLTENARHVLIRTSERIYFYRLPDNTPEWVHENEYETFLASSVSNDGSTIVIGSIYEDPLKFSGFIRTLLLEDNKVFMWSYEIPIVKKDGGAWLEDRWGAYSVGVSPDGNYVIAIAGIDLREVEPSYYGIALSEIAWEGYLLARNSPEPLWTVGFYHYYAPDLQRYYDNPRIAMVSSTHFGTIEEWDYREKFRLYEVSAIEKQIVPQETSSEEPEISIPPPHTKVPNRLKSASQGGCMLWCLRC